MKNNKINKLIAEVCGIKLPVRWFISIDGGKTALMYFDSQEDAFEKLRLAVPCEEHADCCEPQVWCEAKALPNFCEDLNAMHEAEKTLTDDQMWIMARKIELNEDRWYFHASARERAEAFLRTLGKWEEVQG